MSPLATRMDSLALCLRRPAPLHPRFGLSNDFLYALSSPSSRLRCSSVVTPPTPTYGSSAVRVSAAEVPDYRLSPVRCSGLTPQQGESRGGGGSTSSSSVGLLCQGYLYFKFYSYDQALPLRQPPVSTSCSILSRPGDRRPTPPSSFTTHQSSGRCTSSSLLDHPSQDPGVPPPLAGLALTEARASHAVFVGRGRAPILRDPGKGGPIPTLAAEITVSQAAQAPPTATFIISARPRPFSKSRRLSPGPAERGARDGEVFGGAVRRERGAEGRRGAHPQLRRQQPGREGLPPPEAAAAGEVAEQANAPALAPPPP
ncbi:hypothetical protein THAOC_09886, partial [Thalassiosira oceanica]